MKNAPHPQPPPVGEGREGVAEDLKRMGKI